MRKVSFALAVGFALIACGGDEKQPPQTPASTTPPAPTPTQTAEAPKKEDPKPQPTMAELQMKAGKTIAEAMNAHDAKKLASVYTDTAVMKVAGAPQDAVGKEQIQASYQKLFDAFSNYKTAASRVFMKGDVVIVEWAFNGKHTGDLWGIKATEKDAGAMGVDAMWFTPEGLIKEHHVYYDGATILSQIGIVKQKARPIPTLATEPQVFTSNGSPDEQKNVDTGKAISAALEAKKEADFLAGLADNIEYDDMTQPQTAKGKADAKKFFKEMTVGFPDAKYTTANTWAIGEYVISEGTMTGTHKGSFFTLPATKKPVTLKSIDIYQYKDGKLVKGASYSNGADFAQQLGIAPKPPAPKPDAAKPADAKPADKK